MGISVGVAVVGDGLGEGVGVGVAVAGDGLGEGVGVGVVVAEDGVGQGAGSGLAAGPAAGLVRADAVAAQLAVGVGP